MTVQVNPDKEFAEQVRKSIRENGMHCPCQISSEDTICMCKNFREEVKPGEWCICELYKKVSE